MISVASSQASWGAIPGYEAYEVSTAGEVRRAADKRPLKLCKNSKGYLGVTIAKGGRAKNFKVHRLVATVHIRKPIDDEQVNHLDFDKTNNNVENLEWCTSRENIAHYWRSVPPTEGPRNYRPKNGKRAGLDPYGRKLTAEQVIAIRQAVAEQTESLRTLAKRFGSSKTVLIRIKQGQAYAHVV